MTAPQDQEARVITSKSDKGGRLTKIILFVFGLTTLIVLAEVAYLVFGNNGVPFLNLGKQSRQEEGERNFMNLISTFKPLSSKTGEDVNVNSEIIYSFAARLEQMEEKDYLQQSDAAQLYFKLTGTVVEIGTGNKEYEGEIYNNYIRIEKSNGSQMNLWLSTEEMDNARIVLNSSSGIQDITYPEIESGDIITFEETTNLLSIDTIPGLLIEVER